MNSIELLSSIEDALNELAYSNSTATAHKKYAKARGALGELKSLLAEKWYDKIMGMEVSMDVSTGEHDSGNRVFGRVYEVMLGECGAQENTILAIEDSRNHIEVPKINAKFETSSAHCIGTTEAPIKRVERQDDGSVTVVIDYWPK
jgi:hypothetical protein